jgi:hypothetical protein
MKKLALVLALALLVCVNANAEEKYVAGGFEASGHLNAGFGYQYFGKNDATYNNGGLASLVRDNWSNFKITPRNNQFNFILDEVQIDLSKTFGENIRFRADLAFGDSSIGSMMNGINIKQAYATANIAVGNGIELLFGRFAAPIGYESINRNENNTITRSALYNFGIRPWTYTGFKVYYPFTDSFDWHIYAVNNMLDGALGTKVPTAGTSVAAYNMNSDNVILPTFGTRLGYTWGEEGKESTVGLSGVFGANQRTDAGNYSKWGHWTYLADLDWNIYATDAFSIGGEGIYRQDGGNKEGTGSQKAKFMGAILDLNYAFSDVWDGTLKYALLWQNDYTNAGAMTIATNTTRGAYAPQNVGKGYFNEIGLCGGYQITDGAKFKAEYRLDWTKYSNFSKSLAHTVVGQLEYAF